MLKVKYEVYYNDRIRHNESATFKDLNEFTRWIYSVARIWNGKPDIFFVDPNSHEIDGSDLCYGSFEVRVDNNIYWNFCIEDTNRGVIFTCGKFTYGKKHWSKDMREWFIKGRNGELEPKLTFAD